MTKDSGDSGMTSVTGDEDASVPPRKRKATSATKHHAQSEALEHVAVRIPAKDVARIDALAAKHSKPWFKLTRSDMLRKLLLKALNAEGDDAGEEPTDDEGAV
jgi:hypothetical protein